jgi:hypothetical protein
MEEFGISTPALWHLQISLAVVKQRWSLWWVEFVHQFLVHFRLEGEDPNDVCNVPVCDAVSCGYGSSWRLKLVN